MDKRILAQDIILFFFGLLFLPLLPIVVIQIYHDLDYVKYNKETKNLNEIEEEQNICPICLKEKIENQSFCPFCGFQLKNKPEFEIEQIKEKVFDEKWENLKILRRSPFRHY